MTSDPSPLWDATGVDQPFPPGLFTKPAAEEGLKEAAEDARVCILLAEDQVEVRNYITRLLRGRYEVVAVEDGGGALAFVEERIPDLVVTDVMMPNVDGFELLRALRANPRTNTIPVILVSARIDEDSCVEGLQAGAVDYLIKPFSPRELLARVSTHLEMVRLRKEVTARDRVFVDFVENAVVPLHWSGPDGRILWANEAELALLGYAQEDYVGRHLSDFYADQETAQDILQRLSRGEILHNYEARLICEDRTIKDVLIDANVLWKDGRFARTRFFTRDITERKQAELALRKAREELERRVLDRTAELRTAIERLRCENSERTRVQEALRESESRLHAILDNSPAIIFLKDLEGRYLLVNRQFETVFHKTHDYIKGRTDAELFPAMQAAAFRANDIKVLHAGVSMEFEEVALHDDGPHTSIVVKFPLRNADGDIYAVCGIVTDITERKKAEEIRAHLLAKLVSAQEEERKRIAQELHDETGQSLTSMLVGLRTLEEAGSLERVRNQAGDLRTIAARTLDEVRRLALGLRPSLLDDMGLEAALRHYAEEYHRTHHMSVDLCINGLEQERLPPRVETALYRIVQEGLTNVAKHAAARTVSVLLRRTEHEILLIVEDDGCGFVANSMTQAGDATQHLGLHGMQERAALLNGCIKVESSPGKGTAIYVQIPIRQDTQ
jgi:PAS domain S-box-containing protein